VRAGNNRVRRLGMADGSEVAEFDRCLDQARRRYRGTGVSVAA
jgi:hypothetical protein